MKGVNFRELDSDIFSLCHRQNGTASKCTEKMIKSNMRMSAPEGEPMTNAVCVNVPEVQVFRVFKTSVDELFKLAVDFWHKLGEGKLLGERKLDKTEQRTK